MCDSYLGDSGGTIVNPDESWSAMVDDGIVNLCTLDAVVSNSLRRNHRGLVGHTAEGSTTCDKVSHTTFKSV